MQPARRGPTGRAALSPDVPFSLLREKVPEERMRGRATFLEGRLDAKRSNEER